MRFQVAILAFVLGFTPLAVAKDQAETQPPDRAAPAGALGPASARERSAREDVNREGAVELGSFDGPKNEAGVVDTDAQGEDGEVRINATTAPVPVKSLGIGPATAPAVKPGPRTREAETRKVRIGQIAASSTPAAETRKAQSEEILRAAGVPLNLKLPPIVDVGQTTGRTHRQVVGRTLAILSTAVKGEGLDQATVDSLIDDFGVREILSPEEAAFIAQPDPRMIDRVQFAWRYEAAWAMLWALSRVDDLGAPKEIVDVRAIVEIVRGETLETLTAKTKLRSLEEILDEADLIYRYRWALVDAQIKDLEPPAGLDPGVALERHRALNWLIGYLRQDWDDVTPDT